MNISKKLMFSSVVLLTIGVMGMIPYANMWLTKHEALASPSPLTVVHKVPLKPTTITGKPVRINIPSLNDDLQVIDGTYNAKTGAWTLTTDKAQFAVPSTQPNNQAGNTFIYGHYRREVFANLHTIQPGAKATIDTDNGYRFTYTFTNTETKQPNDVDIFAYQGAPRLTIQTCSGAWYQNRQFFYFTYDGYQKI
jgi:LPXTG-site transpeptidase (sortase) family protein